MVLCISDGGEVFCWNVKDGLPVNSRNLAPIPVLVLGPHRPEAPRRKHSQSNPCTLWKTVNYFLKTANKNVQSAVQCVVLILWSSLLRPFLTYEKSSKKNICYTITGCSVDTLNVCHGPQLLWATPDDDRFRSKHVACWQRIKSAELDGAACTCVPYWIQRYGYHSIEKILIIPCTWSYEFTVLTYCLFSNVCYRMPQRFAIPLFHGTDDAVYAQLRRVFVTKLVFK